MELSTNPENFVRIAQEMRRFVAFIFLNFVKFTVFTERRNARIASAGPVLAMAFPSVCLSVRPSVCPSHAGIVSNRRHVARCSLHSKLAKCI